MAKPVLILLSLLAVVNGEGFLRNSGTSGTIDAETLGQDVITAMDEVLGCGGHEVSQERLNEINRALEPMWRTMPSIDGKLDWRSVRYVAHRYFMQQSSLVIRGFEPSRILNSSESGVAELLSKQVPAHSDVLLGGKHASQGYGIDDVVSLVAALERLVWDSEAALLERTYKLYGMKTDRVLGMRQFQRLLEGYIVYWMMRGDERSAHILMRNRTVLEKSFPKWNELRGFIDGRIKRLNWQRALQPKTGDGRTLIDNRYEFQDAHEIVGGITTSFQDYWQSECVSMKNQLVGMDRDGTGRVRLNDFYGTGLEKDWRFGESEQYLRELGVLDESSPWRGKRVIIPNYLQAASNCIVTTPHYLVCCKNECEELLGEIEIAIAAPSATPEEILTVVGNMSAPSNEDDDPPKLDGVLTKQLQNIAEGHGLQVTLHGRLFSQWMHYAFPRECPFPHKAGAYESHTLTPNAYGRDYIASEQEMQSHAETRQSSEEDPIDLEKEMLTQWSEEEELFANYSSQGSPWKQRALQSFGLVMIMCGIVFLLVKNGVISESKTKERIPFHSNCKSHLV